MQVKNVNCVSNILIDDITCTIPPGQLTNGNIQDPGSVNAGTSVTVTCVPGWLWSDSNNTNTVQCLNSGSWNVNFATDKCSSKYF